MLGEDSTDGMDPFPSSGGDSEDPERLPLIDSTSSPSKRTAKVTQYRPRSLRKLILLILISLVFLFTFLLYARNGNLSGNFSFPERNRTHPYFLPFNYTILEDKICESPLDFLIVVHTSVAYFNRRALYRETFSNKKWEKRYHFRTVYAVARAKDNKTEERVREESEKYHDIIQADFVDSYKNLTIKNMMWLRYVRDYCPKVKYILKIDDDVVFNLFEFVEHLHGKNLTIPRSICCSRHQHSKIVRDPKSIWYVPNEALPGTHFKPYCSGPAYFLTADLVDDLIRQTEAHQHYVSVDDAFMTGAIASEINVTANNLFYNRLNVEPSNTEFLILKKKIWFGYYKNVDSFKRIWNSLVAMYGQG